MKITLYVACVYFNWQVTTQPLQCTTSKWTLAWKKGLRLVVLALLTLDSVISCVVMLNNLCPVLKKQN